MGAAIDKFDDSPVAIYDHIRNLHFPIRKRPTPSFVVHSVTLGSDLLLVTGDVLEFAVVGYHGNAAVWVTHVPGFMKLADNSFSRMHVWKPFFGGAVGDPAPFFQ